MFPQQEHLLRQGGTRVSIAAYCTKRIGGSGSVTVPVTFGGVEMPPALIAQLDEVRIIQRRLAEQNPVAVSMLTPQTSLAHRDV